MTPQQPPADELRLTYMLDYAYGKIMQRFKDREPSSHAWNEQLSVVNEVFFNIKRDDFWSRPPAVSSAHVPNCDRCGCRQTELGGLLFSPPVDNKVVKLHLCTKCYLAVSAVSKPSDEGK